MSDSDFSNPAIELIKVCAFRGDRRVLDNVSWKVNFQEHWFIMGNNGSGKTSLLEVILGYLWAAQGTVRVLGHPYGAGANILALRRRIGYVAPWIFERMPSWVSVRDAVASGLNASTGFMREISAETDRQVIEQLEFWGCTSFAGRRFGRLSSGEQLKIALARALISRPAILILDEPFSLLDIGSRFKIYDLMAGLVAGGQAPVIILVSHHLDDIQAFFTHGMLIRDGQVIRAAGRDEILVPEAFRDAFDISPSENIFRSI